MLLLWFSAQFKRGDLGLAPERNLQHQNLLRAWVVGLAFIRINIYSFLILK